MDRRRAYEINGVDELELAVSERSGESSAESGVGTVSTRGRSMSTRWGSSETDRLTCGGCWLIERAGLGVGGNNQRCYSTRGRIGGGGTKNVHGYPSLTVASTAFFFFHSKSLRVSHLVECFGERFPRTLLEQIPPVISSTFFPPNLTN